MGRSDGKSTTKSTVPDKASDRERLLQYISDEIKTRNKPPTWERLASILFNDACKGDYVQFLLQDQSVPEHLRTWATSSETCEAGGVKRERSGSAERSDESSGGEEETAGIESGAANAGGADVAEQEVNPFLDAIIVFINQTLRGEKPFVSTLQLQRTALGLCAVCRCVPSLTLRVRNGTLEYLQASPSRVPILRPSSLKGECIKQALLSQNYSRIDCTSASRIRFRKTFNEPIGNIPWPRSLQQLEFGTYFDQPIVSVEWPSSLQILIFPGKFNQPVEGISWPRDLRELNLGLTFNHPVEGVALPKSLETIWFGPRFNQPIEGVKFPSIAKLELEDDFNQPVAKVGWPESLQRLIFGDSFNQEIEHVKWPRLLQKLAFGDMFNKRIEHVSWPAGLKKLTFAWKFDQPMEGVTWPTSLEVLIFGDHFNHPIEGGKFPESLKELRFGLDFFQPIDNVAWPQALEYLHLDNTQYALRLGRIVWPRSAMVTIGEETAFSVGSSESDY